MIERDKHDEEWVRKQCLEFIWTAGESRRLADQLERARDNQDFYRGHHYSEEEWSYYRSKGVDPVTINRCRPTVKAAVGMYLRNRQQLTVLPRKGANNNAAQVWSELVKHSEDLADAEFGYTELFLRGCIDTESYLVLDIDEQRNPNGQPTIEVVPLADAEVDPNAHEYDLNISGKFFIRKKWVDKDWLATKYPDALKTYDEGDYGLNEGDMGNIGDLAAYLAGDRTEQSQQTESEEDLELMKKYRYRIRIIFWREVVKGVMVVDSEAKTVHVYTDDKQVATFKKLARKKSKRFTIKEVPAYVLHTTEMLGGTLLQDTKNPFGEKIRSLPAFRFSPFWDAGGYAQGVLDDIKSLNREENIHRTQTIKLLNQTANSGYKVKGGSAKDQKELIEYGSVEGLVIDVTKFGGLVEKIEPNQLPVGFFRTGEQFEQDIKRVSQFDDATMGYNTGKSESGRAIDLKRNQNQVSTEPVFGNFYYTLTVFGNYLLKLIKDRNVYTDDEIRQVVAESSLIDLQMLQKAHDQITMQIGGDLPQPMMPQQLTPNPDLLANIRPQDRFRVQQQLKTGIDAATMYAKEWPRLKRTWDEVVKEQAVVMLLEKVKSDPLAEYGIKVTVSPSAPTERIARFAEMDLLMSKYPGIIPPDIFIDATDIPNKNEIKARLRQQQAAPPQLPAQRTPARAAAG